MMKKIHKIVAFLLTAVMMTAAVSCQKEVTAENLMENIGQGNASEVDLDDAFCKKYSSVAFNMLKNEAPRHGELRAFRTQFKLIRRDQRPTR